MSSYNIVLSSDEATVVAEYTPEYRSSAASDYQSEATLEKEFLKNLVSLGYEYIDVMDEKSLVENLRKQLEKLNNFNFSDEEWKRFFTSSLASSNEGVKEKTRKIQSDHIQLLKRDDGTTKNIALIDKKNIHNNKLQVLNQYEEKSGTHDTRYDVTILVNGLPIVHVELKRRGVAIREAFNQIKRYQRDSFWAGSGLYEYIQIFVISNGTHTKYYSNTTRYQHIKESIDSSSRSNKTSHSFEFTSFWADASNKIIADLTDFTKTFFVKHTLLNILTRYCVFTSQELLLVMRPYQIAAAEYILNKIVISSTYNQMGTEKAGGFIWHTTGSGKTLTSFKTAQLATALPYIAKVLFVVDRKDLDYQTIKEYDRFQKGAANSNTSTAILTKQLTDTDTSIIITTIQKLDRFIRKNKNHEIYKKHVVLIFDECHRSQFGEMHSKIVKAFKNYHIFGFTGTPIFSKNAGAVRDPSFCTTPQAFGEQLHTYTIVNAINDGNVLPFRIDYVTTMKSSAAIKDKDVHSIDTEKALSSPQRISNVVSYILEHFDQKTKRHSYYMLEGRGINGFNSIFTVSSIPMAIQYYAEFQKQLKEKNCSLSIATIFTYTQNEDDPEDGLLDEGFETDRLDHSSRDFLESAISDYNQMFNTNYDTSADKFQNYYKDVSLKVKKRQLDLLIVVNMFLTGFDATTLNTLWVDKNLRYHGLLQAFSRTNRILNSVKTFGNIICFRDLRKETDEAIALFGDKNANGIVLLKTYLEYYNGYEENGKFYPGYIHLIANLLDRFPLGEAIIGDKSEKEFIKLFGKILKLRNILTAFDDFYGNEILPARDLQDYQSIYIDLYEKRRQKEKADKENINDDIVFEMELIKQLEVNIDYILMLVAKYHETNCTDKSIIPSITKLIDSTLELRSKKKLIEEFIERVSSSANIEDEWRKFVAEQKEKDLNLIIEEEKLKPDETHKFIKGAFRDGFIKTIGSDIDKILPPISRFFNNGISRSVKKQQVIDKLQLFFEKYSGTI